jgi:hypothetical protein
MVRCGEVEPELGSAVHAPTTMSEAPVKDTPASAGTNILVQPRVDMFALQLPDEISAKRIGLNAEESTKVLLHERGLTGYGQDLMAIDTWQKRRLTDVLGSETN